MQQRKMDTQEYSRGDAERPAGNKTWKLLLPLCVLLAGLLAVAVRLFVVQIIDGPEYREQARRQYESRVTLAADRGDIYDRNGKLVATTMPRLSIAVDPNMVEQPERIAALLSSLTGKPAKDYMDRIRSATTSFVWLERALDGAEFSPLDTLRDIGLVRVREPRRSFAFGSLAAQILGFTNIDNKGVSGIELAWDSVLHGSNGSMILQRDGRGRKRPSPDMPMVPPKDGHSLVLTLDMSIQGIAESELARGVQEARAESGTVIAIRPSTGEILAMASYPTYNPNNPSTAAPELVRNRAITDMYEPGSTFKLVTAAALLEEQLIHPVDTVDARGGVMQIRDYTVRDAHPMHRMTFAESIEHSSNVVFASLAGSISNDKFYKYVRDFGFGIVLGVDLPGEVRGIVKKPREFDHTTKTFMAFGYELAATALQIVNAYATVANGGVMMKPYVVQKVLDREGEEISVYEPQTIRRVIDESTAHQISSMLTGVVERGTGKAAQVQGVRIAGKTGTAQQLVDGKYSKQNYTASFVGFFPAEQPEIALIVMLDRPRNGYYGGEVSAPIFQRIVRRIVSASLVTPPEPAGAIAQVDSHDTTQPQPDLTVTVPDVRGLAFADATDLLHQFGLRLKSVATQGIVYEQTPLPGTELERGSEIAVRFRLPADSTQTTIPDVRGMTLRRALNILNAAQIRTRVVGSGVVVAQRREKKGRDVVCVLECRTKDTR